MLTNEQIDCVWRSMDYGLRHDDFRITLGRAIETEVRKEIEAAVLAEREACAVIAGNSKEFPVSGTADGVAMAIRARSQHESSVHKEAT